MKKNKIMVLAIGMILFGGMAGAQTLRMDNGPEELPPKSFKGKQYVDSKGCVYIKAGYGTRITWVPRVNRQRKVFCSKNNQPSLSSTQLAAISGIPATRVKKTNKVAKAVTVKPTTPLMPKPEKTTKVAVADPKVQTAKPARTVDGTEAQKTANLTSVRGVNQTDRQNNRDAIRTTPQTVHPEDLIYAQQTPQTKSVAMSNQAIADRRGVDLIHKITVYPTVIDADVTPRGDAQMALVWSNTVPRRLIKKVRAKQVASSDVFTTSTKSRKKTLR